MTPSLWVIICLAVVAMCVLFIEPLRKIFALVVALAVAFALGLFWPTKDCQHFRVVEAKYIPAIFGKR
jgi:hypothetical protein